MARNHLLTAKVWQSDGVKRVRHALSVNRIYRRISAGTRRLPDYIIAGAQKSGTTSLWAYLNEHARVEPALMKEMHFFDNNYHRGITWYRSHFPFEHDNRLHASSGGSTLVGESSAYYMFHPLSARRIKEAVPECKIILLMRNPIDRAFSHYQLKLRRRQETLSFDEALDAEAARLEGEEERILDSPFYHSLAHDRFSYMARGHYLEQIIRWQKLFAPNQLMIIESGDLFKRTADVYQRVLQFLDLPSWQPAQFGNRFPGKYKEKMLDATRRRLIDHFAPRNARLNAHLGTAFDWDK